MNQNVDPRARNSKVFPELDTRDVRPIGTGWTVDTYEVDDGWIVQFPRNDRAAERLRAQIATLPELAAELPALVPEPTYVDADGPAIAYRKIDGVPLDEAPDGLWPERLGRFLYDLHLMPPEYVGSRGCTASEVRNALRSELDRFGDRVLPLLDAEESAHIGSCFTAFIDDDDLWRFAPCLTHRDLGPEHVLVSTSGDLAGCSTGKSSVSTTPSRTSRGCSMRCPRRANVPCRPTAERPIPPSGRAARCATP